jgi:hypothetical protein
LPPGTSSRGGDIKQRRLLGPLLALLSHLRLPPHTHMFLSQLDPETLPAAPSATQPPGRPVPGRRRPEGPHQLWQPRASLFRVRRRRRAARHQPPRAHCGGGARRAALPGAGGSRRGAIVFSGSRSNKMGCGTPPGTRVHLRGSRQDFPRPPAPPRPSPCPHPPPQVARFPFAGVDGPYRASADPWRMDYLRAYAEEFYSKVAQWLANPYNKTFKVQKLFIWSHASFDVLGIVSGARGRGRGRARAAWPRRGLGHALAAAGPSQDKLPIARPIPSLGHAVSAPAILPCLRSAA